MAMRVGTVAPTFTEHVLATGETESIAVEGGRKAGGYALALVVIVIGIGLLFVGSMQRPFVA